jgi:hypothetical protein
MIIIYKHPTYYAFKKTRIAKTFHFGTTKYNHILYVFDNHGNIIMYDNNVILQIG